MSDGIELLIGDDGVARQYDSTWDITIHCENEEEQKRAIKSINSANRCRWIDCSEKLPDEPTNGMHDLEEYAEYNVMIDGASLPTTLYYMGDGEWWREGTFYKVERWAYLPEP